MYFEFGATLIFGSIENRPTKGGGRELDFFEKAGKNFNLEQQRHRLFLHVASLRNIFRK